MTSTCEYCHTSPCRCESYLVGNDEISAWEDSSGEHLNRFSARRLMATARSLRARAEAAEKALAEARKAWDELFLHISDDQGFIYDSDAAECQTCGKRAKDISSIQHDSECFTVAVQVMCAAIDAAKEGE